MHSNYRFVSPGDRSLNEWQDSCSKENENLDSLLNLLVKREIGNEYMIKYQQFQGYLGVTSDRYYEVVKLSSDA